MKREEAKLINSLLSDFVKKAGLEKQLRTIDVFDAWDIAVGKKGAKITSSKFLKEGILFCTISSSIGRNELQYQLHNVIEKINSLVPGTLVKKIVLK